MLSPKKLIQNARNRIAKRENYVQGTVAARKTVYVDPYAYDPTPVERDVTVMTTDPEATCWCALGALAAEAGVSTLTTGQIIVSMKDFAEGREVLDVVSRVALDLLKENGRAPYEHAPIASHIYMVNDQLGHEKVLEMFDRAEAALRGE